jgi:hypothetical protein
MEILVKKLHRQYLVIRGINVSQQLAFAAKLAQTCSRLKSKAINFAQIL